MMTSTENLDLIKDLSARSFETAKAFGELNLSLWEKMAAKQMETFNLILDSSLEQVKLTTESKDINELAESQAELTKKLGEALVTKSKEGMELATEMREQYQALTEKSIDEFTSKITEVAKEAA